MPSKTLARFDLTAELAKAQGDHARSRASREVSFTKGAQRSLDGKDSVKDWAKSHRQINRGVEARAAKDRLDGYDVTQGNEAARARAILTEKAKYYEKLRKGQTAGLTPQQISQLMVDFDAKSDVEDSDSEDEERMDRDESAVVPRKPRSDDEADDPNDPIVEYQDEFGRTRTARQSQVPRAAQQKAFDTEAEQVDDANVYTGDQTHFHVYEPSPEEIAARLAARGETSATGPLNVHYDANSELRDRGAAHRVLSRDEKTRQAQRAAFDREHDRIVQEQEAEARKRAAAKAEEDTKRAERLQQVQANRERILAKRKAAEEAANGEQPATKLSRPS